MSSRGPILRSEPWHSLPEQTWMNDAHHPRLATACTDDASWPIMLRLLGNFRLLQTGQLVPVRAGGRTEAPLAPLGPPLGPPRPPPAARPPSLPSPHLPPAPPP